MALDPCDLEIDDFEINDCDNTPVGVHHEVILTFAKWLNPIPAQDDYPTTGLPLNISSDITLDTTTYTTAKWAKWTGVPTKSSFDSEASGDPGATTLDSFVDFFVSGSSQKFSWILSRSLNQPMFGFFRYNNTKWRTLGSVDFPIYLTYTEKTGKTKGDVIGYDVKLNVGVHNKPFPWYTGVIPT